MTGMDTTASADVAVSVPRSARRRFTWRRTIVGVVPSWWPLVLILALQAGVALATLHNTAFQDEGLYLYAGRQILRHLTGGPSPVENYAFYFSGYPYIYPLIGGFLDKVGGLELARAFSLVCMLGVSTSAYLCTRRLFQAPAAIFAAAIYVSLGTVLFLSRLATYDALCLLLVALATGLAVHVSVVGKPWRASMLGPLLVLAMLTKYAALIFVPPILALLVLGSIAFHGWRRAAGAIAIALGALGASLLVAYHYLDKSALHAIAGSTTARETVLLAPRLGLFLHVLYMGGIVYAAALVGLVLVFRRTPRLRLIALVLFGASWLMPIYHIYQQESISLDKHMAFSLFFAVPLAGYAIASLGGDIRRAVSGAARQYRLAGVSFVLIVFVLGLQQSQTLYSGWANTTDLSYVLHTQLRDGSGRYFAEDIEVARYDAQDVTEPWQWTGPYYFEYVTAAHQPLFGGPALQQAIKNRYFVIVELSFIYQPNVAYFVATQMAESRNYDLISRVSFRNSYGTGYFYVWRSAPVAGQGTFRSLAPIGI